jgi:mitochondrial distribution and morphology protein 12
MSIELNWETLTTGPDGEALAARIRDFIHDKFQAVPLPRFIKSVNVHEFEFGAVPPQVELKDITDPLPDFYEDNAEDEEDEEDEDENGDGDDETGEREGHKDHGQGSLQADRLGSLRQGAPARPGMVGGQSLPNINTAFPRAYGGSTTPFDLGSPFLGMSQTPGLPGGASHLHYFHSQFATGLSGTQTPLAVVAGAQFGGARGGTPPLQDTGAVDDSHEARHLRNPSRSSNISVDGITLNPSPDLSSRLSPSGGVGGTSSPGYFQPSLREKHSVSTLAPTSVNTSRPPTRDTTGLSESAIEDDEDEDHRETNDTSTLNSQQQRRRFREPRIEDIQAVFRIRYAGDVRLLLTAEILLDYPMPSFVGIPLRLSITGLTFDGVGVVAYIRKRIHFCFLSPEDALAAVGDESSGSASTEHRDGQGHDDDGLDDLQTPAGTSHDAQRTRSKGVGGLLQEIRVESEIGQREGGKQSLKNVGKVERFVLEQVRRIFDEEFVYPSFWTFLV